MRGLKHVIVTTADADHADFLISHWLESLVANVNLDGIDVVVLDYGMLPEQRSALERHGVVCHEARKDGHVTNIRYRDIATLLAERRYDQVLSIDGGDVIFQSDISHLFEEHKTEFRAACEDVSVPLHDLIVSRADFTPDQYSEITRFLRGTENINGGVVFGPAREFENLWEAFGGLCQGAKVYASDQLLINFIFYRDGFHRLDSGYNFVPSTTKRPFHIRDGVFHDEQGQIIPVIHNAGMSKTYRCIGNFGFGSRFNRKKRFTLLGLHLLYAGIAAYRKVRYPHSGEENSK